VQPNWQRNQQANALGPEKPGISDSSASERSLARTWLSAKSRRIDNICDEKLVPCASRWRCSIRRSTPRCWASWSAVLIRLPDGIADSTAATIMMQGMTAQYLLRQVFALKGGETIRHHAAAGGVGLIARQWARAIGVTMIVTVGSDEKAALARANGCTQTIAGSCENIVERVREITGGKGVAVVYDSVGRDTPEASLNCLQPRGTLVSNGTSSGPVVIDTMQLAAKGSLWLTRPAMMHIILPRSHMLEMAGEVFGMVLDGRVRSEPSQTFALADAADAHRALESRRTTGATVLLPRGACAGQTPRARSLRKRWRKAPKLPLSSASRISRIRFR
jgi:Zinc-binding dehydrogenase